MSTRHDPLKSRLSLLACRLIFAVPLAAQNLVVNGDFSTGDLTGWTVQKGGVDQTVIAGETAEGNPAGAAGLDRVSTSLLDNGDILYQVIPVTVGHQYQFAAEWKGDLLNGGSGRNWAEAMIAFTDDPGSPVFTIQYKKASDGGPNPPPAEGWDWESVLLAPDGGPANGVFTATGDYMVVAFNLGGRAQTSNDTQPGYYFVDNVSVVTHTDPAPPSIWITQTVASSTQIDVEGGNGPAEGTYEVLRSFDLDPVLDHWSVIATHAFDAAGDFQFSLPLESAPASFFRVRVSSLLSHPVFLEAPTDFSAIAGQDVTFSVTADGAPPLEYQWFFNGDTPLAGATEPILTLTNVQAAQAGNYTVRVTTPFGTLTSDPANLAISGDRLAFPEAEGYGRTTVGGRGGAVYEVTTLNPTGPGSLGAAIGASGPRTVVFRVAGTIEGNFSINRDNITIAGQTAPGDGICIKGSLSVNADEVIIRYLRVRPNPSVGEVDAIGGRYHRNIILDHISASWSSDEAFSIYRNENVTLQWCLITEACVKFVDGVDTGHRFGGIWGNKFSTYHHNLFAHNDSRNPRWSPGSGYNDYRNNVLYNWGYQSCYGGEGADTNLAQYDFFTVNMVANYYKPGPATASNVRRRIAAPSGDATTGFGSWYVAGNVVEGYPDVTADNWKGIDGSAFTKLSAPWNALAINEQSAEDAYLAVIAHGGCSKPNRDAVDARILDEVANGTTTYGNNGIIVVPADVGGWPTLASGTPPADSDHDGMPDGWETEHGLNPALASDRNLYTLDPAYTNLEVYLNELGAF